MIQLRLHWPDPVGPAMHAAWRSVVALPAPPLPGLRARQWLMDKSGLQGSYLFVDEGSAIGFLMAPSADPAYAALAARWQEAPGATILEAASLIAEPVFIIAAPRSGSTLLFDLLSQAPGIWTQGGEGQGAIDGIAGLNAADRGYDSDRLEADQLNDRARDCLQAGLSFGLRDRHGHRPGASPAAPALRLLDKTTENSLRVAFLARAFPTARFIFLHRDARQNVSSLMQAWPREGFARWRQLPGWPRGQWSFLLPPGWRGLPSDDLQAVATAQWTAANHYALYDLEPIERGRWMSVDYNSLVARPDGVVRQVCDFLQLEVDQHLAGVLERPLAVSGTAISPPSVLKWRSNGELDVLRLEAATRSTSGRLRELHSLSAPPPARMPLAAPCKARFACHLDDVAEPGSLPAGDLLVSPSLRCQLGASIPMGMTKFARFRERFLPDQPILWSYNTLTQSYRPYWVGRHQIGLFRQFAPGAPAPPCPEQLTAQLHAAEVVGTVEELGQWEAAAQAAHNALQGQFSRDGYCVVDKMLPLAQTRALTRYYRELIVSGGWSEGDSQVAQRHGWHNESVARFFHHQFISLVSAIVGERVCPSYTYVSAYRQGAELNPHIDRKQCIYTLSVIFDEVGGSASDWPLWFLPGERASSVSLGLGQGVLFRGHDLPHWREPAPREGLALSTLLFHYVPADFNETVN